MTRKWRDLLIVLLGVVIGTSLLVSSTPEARASNTDFAKAAHDVFTGKDLTTQATEILADLKSLADQTNKDPAQAEEIMFGVDSVIGGPASAQRASAPDIYHGIENYIFSFYGRLSDYYGTVSDTLWTGDPLLKSREIIPVNASVAYLKPNGFGFMGVREGTSEYGQSDASLGLQRCRWAIGGCTPTEPGPSLRMSMTLGNLPSSVTAGDTVTVSATPSVVAADLVYDWYLCYGTPKVQEVVTASPTHVTSAYEVGCGIWVTAYASKAGYRPAIASSWDLLGALIQVTDGTTPPPPVNKTFKKVYTPKVSGKAKVGYTLKASVKSSSPKATHKAYQWNRDAAPITGATKSKYKVAPSDIGHAITVSVTSSRAGYTSAIKTSKPTKRVVPGTIKLTVKKPKGTARVGRTLTANVKVTSGVKLTYQWKRSGKAITGATKNTYKLTKADKGKRITVKVTGTKTGYTTTSKTSKKTSKVK